MRVLIMWMMWRSRTMPAVVQVRVVYALEAIGLVEKGLLAQSFASEAWRLQRH